MGVAARTRFQLFPRPEGGPSGDASSEREKDHSVRRQSKRAFQRDEIRDRERHDQKGKRGKTDRRNRASRLLGAAVQSRAKPLTREVSARSAANQTAPPQSSVRVVVAADEATSPTDDPVDGGRFLTPLGSVSHPVRGGTRRGQAAAPKTSSQEKGWSTQLRRGRRRRASCRAGAGSHCAAAERLHWGRA